MEHEKRERAPRTRGWRVLLSAGRLGWAPAASTGTNDGGGTPPPGGAWSRRAPPDGLTPGHLDASRAAAGAGPAEPAVPAVAGTGQVSALRLTRWGKIRV